MELAYYWVLWLLFSAMACGATLKRHHEFDPHLGIPNGCSPKRIKISYEDMMATDTYQPSQNFVEATQRLAHGEWKKIAWVFQ